jgi:GNAT superfamily N-acetyltransferase
VETRCIGGFLIRSATAQDIPRIVEMGLHFHQGSPYRAHIKENPQQMRNLAEHLVLNKGLLLSERQGEICGMFGYFVYPHFMSGEVVAGEVFWWVEPEHRGEGVKLLKEAEKRAKSSGAKRMQMIAPDDRIGMLYKRLGYEFVESSYQKTI